MTSVAIVILNFNGQRFLEQFLPSVVKNSPNYQIYVADNASSDNSVSFLKSNFPNVKIIELSENYGYAGGYNKALQQIKADYFVLLNSDVEVTEHWLDNIIEKMEQSPYVAAAQPKILDFNRKNYFEYAGASGGFIDKYGYPFCRGRIFTTLEKDNKQYDDEQPVFWASGACLIVKSKPFFEAGMLDDFFFAHMEEIDLCWRLQKLGYKIMVYPQSTVYHVGGGTLNKVNPRKTFLNFRNNLLLLHKNLEHNRSIILLLRLLLDGVAGVKFLLEGKPHHTWAVIKAHFSFYAAAKQNKKKRITAKTNHLKGVYHHLILTDYYLKGKKYFSQLNFKE